MPVLPPQDRSLAMQFHRLRPRGLAIYRVALIVFASVLIAPASPRAQGKGSVAGVIRDRSGKPWSFITVTFLGTAGHVETVASTHDDGKYSADLPSGNYAMELRERGRFLIRIAVSVFANTQTPGDVNFKTFESAYQNLQLHFESGEKDLELIKKTRDQIAKLQNEMDQSGVRAVAELQQALLSTGDSDQFFHRFSVLAKLGETYDAVGDYDQAARFYSQAVALHADPIAYDDLSNDLAKSGDFTGAAEACKRSVELDPAGAGHVYLNLAINLYNAQHYQDALAPARQAANLDSSSAKSWYVLAAALSGTITFVQSGDKISPIVPDGLTEAYGKTVALDPNGKWGHLAQDGLHQLQQMMSGVETKASLKPIR
ncbi:MAG TPA: hypothetical protein VFO34_08685 [Candidatus Acidoferrales bacterium]|nr:hypothetical protein [Candidatus Acidoferrales bacterium]